MSNSVKTIKKFSPQQEMMFEKLENYVLVYEVFKLYKIDLSNILKIPERNLSMAISRLNKQFREIYNTKTNFLKCIDKENPLYKITDIWKLKLKYNENLKTNN